MKITVSLDEKDLDAVADAIADRVIAQVKESLGSAAKDEGAKKAAPVKEVADKKPASNKKAEPKKPEPKEEPEEGTEEAAESKVVTRDEALAKLREVKETKGVAKSLEVLNKYAKTFSAVEESDYAALVSDLEAALEDGEASGEDDPFA